MAEANTGTAGAPPAADIKAMDPKLLEAFAAEQVRAEQKIHAAHKAATTGENLAADVITKANTARDEGLNAVKEGILKRFGNEADKAAYKATYDAKAETFKKGLEDIKGLSKGFTSVMSRLHGNPKTAMAVGATLAVAGTMLPGKEVEQPDGTTKKKGNLFKTALVTIGAAIAIGAAVNKFGPGSLKGFAGKIAAERLASAAQGVAGASVGG